MTAKQNRRSAPIPSLARRKDEIVKAAIAFVGEHWRWCTTKPRLLAVCTLLRDREGSKETRRLLRAVAAVKKGEK